MVESGVWDEGFVGIGKCYWQVLVNSQDRSVSWIGVPLVNDGAGIGVMGLVVAIEAGGFV